MLPIGPQAAPTMYPGPRSPACLSFLCRAAEERSPRPRGLRFSGHSQDSILSGCRRQRRECREGPAANPLHCLSVGESQRQPGGKTTLLPSRFSPRCVYGPALDPPAEAALAACPELDPATSALISDVRL